MISKLICTYDYIHTTVISYTHILYIKYKRYYSYKNHVISVILSLIKKKSVKKGVLLCFDSKSDNMTFDDLIALSTFLTKSNANVFLVIMLYIAHAM